MPVFFREIPIYDGGFNYQIAWFQQESNAITAQPTREYLVFHGTKVCILLTVVHNKVISKFVSALTDTVTMYS